GGAARENRARRRSPCRRTRSPAAGGDRRTGAAGCRRSRPGARPRRELSACAAWRGTPRSAARRALAASLEWHDGGIAGRRRRDIGGFLGSPLGGLVLGRRALALGRGPRIAAHGI